MKTHAIWNGISVLVPLQNMIDGKQMTNENTEPCLFTSVGGYPLAYAGDGECLCPDCMHRDGNEEQSFVAFINFEDQSLYCDECGYHIECAYPLDEEQ